MLRTWWGQVVLYLAVAAIGVLAGVLIAGRPEPIDSIEITSIPTTTTDPLPLVSPVTVAPPTSAVTSPGAVATTGTTSTTTPAATSTSSSAALRTASIYVLGDSYTAGTDVGGEGAANWTELVREQLLAQGIDATFEVDAVEDTGFVSTADEAAGFAERVPDALPADIDVVIVFGNDALEDADDVGDAAEQTFAAIGEAAPAAELVVIGPPWINDEVPAIVEDVRAAVEAAAADAGAEFLDPIEEGWFTDDAEGLIGEEDLLPTDAGHAEIASRVLPVLVELLAT